MSDTVEAYYLLIGFLLALVIWLVASAQHVFSEKKELRVKHIPLIIFGGDMPDSIGVPLIIACLLIFAFWPAILGIVIVWFICFWLDKWTGIFTAIFKLTKRIGEFRIFGKSH